MKAKFEIHDTFRLSNRGIVLIGTIVEGIVQIGDFISFQINESPWRMEIKGIDAGMRRPPGEATMGLLLPYPNETELPVFLDWEPNQQMGIVEEGKKGNA